MLVGDFVYWVEHASNVVRRIRKDKMGGIEDLATGPRNTAAGGIAVDAVHVYWVVAREKSDASAGSGGLYRAPRNGGMTEPVLENLDFPVDVVLDGTYAYVTVKNENRVLRIGKQ